VFFTFLKFVFKMELLLKNRQKGVILSKVTRFYGTWSPLCTTYLKKCSQNMKMLFILNYFAPVYIGKILYCMFFFGGHAASLFLWAHAWPLMLIHIISFYQANILSTRTKILNLKIHNFIHSDLYGCHSYYFFLFDILNSYLIFDNA